MKKDKEGKGRAVVKTTEYCSGELDSCVAAIKFPGDTISINHLNKSFHKCSDMLPMLGKGNFRDRNSWGFLQQSQACSQEASRIN